jgi:hypothetical protein
MIGQDLKAVQTEVLLILDWGMSFIPVDEDGVVSEMEKTWRVRTRNVRYEAEVRGRKADGFSKGSKLLRYKILISPHTADIIAARLRLGRPSLPTV